MKEAVRQSLPVFLILLPTPARHSWPLGLFRQPPRIRGPVEATRGSGHFLFRDLEVYFFPGSCASGQSHICLLEHSPYPPAPPPGSTLPAEPSRLPSCISPMLCSVLPCPAGTIWPQEPHPEPYFHSSLPAKLLGRVGPLRPNTPEACP